MESNDVLRDLTRKRSLLDDMLKWKDVLDTVREEMGIDLSIR